jgi:hypothetical protein
LEASESACRRSEIESDKIRCKSTQTFYFVLGVIIMHYTLGYSAGQLESELSRQNQLLQTKGCDLISAKEEVNYILNLTE